MQLSELLIRAFKDQKCPQWPNVLGLTLCVRSRIQTQPKNTSSSLLCPNLEKPRGSSKNCHNPVSFTRKKKQVWSWLSSVGDLDTWSFSWKANLYERDWLQSTCWLFIIKTWLRFKLHRRQPQNDRHTVTNLKSVNDNQTVSQKQINQFPSPCFIFAAFFPQSCRIA